MPSDTQLADAVKNVGTSGDGLIVAGDLKSKTIGAEGTKSWDTKKHGTFSLSGAWQYTKDLGNTLIGKFTWKPK